MGRVDEFQLTATNHGLITAENVTLSWSKYYYNVEFILPDLDTNDDGALILGDLPANSSYTITIGVKQLSSIDIPDDSQYVRFYQKGVVFMTTATVDDEDAFDMVYASFSDPIGNRGIVRFKNESFIDFAFDNGTSTLYRPVYSTSGEIIDTITTPNATFPTGDHRQLAMSSHYLRPHRRLGFWACVHDIAEAFACAAFGTICLALNCKCDC